MGSLEYIRKKFDLNLTGPLPIEIPNFGRNGLALLFAELGFKIGAEIGVRDGDYSEILCRANARGKLFGVDPWEVHDEYREMRDQTEMDANYSEARRRLAPYNCELIRKMSMDAVNDFKDGSLDYVYIDANHDFLHVVEDIHAWSKKVRLDGIVSGHDFKRHSKADFHVVQAVTGYTDAYQINPWFVLGRKHEPKGMVRDLWRSWMWVKA